MKRFSFFLLLFGLMLFCLKKYIKAILGLNKVNFQYKDSFEI